MSGTPCRYVVFNPLTQQPLGPFISHSSPPDRLPHSSPSYSVFPNSFAFICSFNKHLLVTIMPGPTIGIEWRWDGERYKHEKSPCPLGATSQGWRPTQEHVLTKLCDECDRSCVTWPHGGAGEGVANVGKDFQRRRHWSWVLKAEQCVPGRGVFPAEEYDVAEERAPRGRTW